MTWVASGTAFLVSMVMGLVWLRALRPARTGSWIPSLNVLGLLSVGLALVALVSAADLGPRLLAVAALGTPAAFFALQLFARQPSRRVAVEVGGPIKAFQALDGNGQPFDLASMHGSAYLLKFYRGHW